MLSQFWQDFILIVESLILLINVIFLVLSLVHRHLYGNGTFDKVEFKGPFADQIAFKEFHCKKTECAVSVYFPVNK